MKKIDYSRIVYVVMMIFIAFKYYNSFDRESVVGAFFAINIAVVAYTLLSINNKMRNKK